MGMRLIIRMTNATNAAGIQVSHPLAIFLQSIGSPQVPWRTASQPAGGQTDRPTDRLADIRPDRKGYSNADTRSGVYIYMHMHDDTNKPSCPLPPSSPSLSHSLTLFYMSRQSHSHPRSLSQSTISAHYRRETPIIYHPKSGQSNIHLLFLRICAVFTPPLPRPDSRTARQPGSASFKPISQIPSTPPYPANPLLRHSLD